MSETCGKRSKGGPDGKSVYECLKLAGHKGMHTYGRRELVEAVRESANPVQEAWREHRIAIRASGWGCRCRPEDGLACEHRTECEEGAERAARAFGLAVLEAAALPHDHARSRAMCGCCHDWGVIRAELESLGHE